MIDAAATPTIFCIPGDIGLPTGGYRYDREVLARLPACGIAVDHCPLPGGYPDPSAADLDATRAVLAAASPDAVLMIDGLALGAMPPSLVGGLPNRVVALVHHPLGLETGVAPDRASWLLANERTVLERVHHVIVTSGSTKRFLIGSFHISEDRITVAEPGTAAAARAGVGGPPYRLLAVGAVSERKAYDRLVEALAPLADLDWSLTIAGSLTLSPGSTAKLRDVIAASPVGGRIALAGALDDAALAELYAHADMFVAASLYEGYGMALAEALARGLPIVGSSGGAAADILPDGASIKVAPGDIPALTSALRRVMSEPGLQRSLADGAWAAGARLPRWDDTARTVAAAIKRASP